MTDVAVGRIRVEVAGDGPAVMMVHGLGGSSNSFQTLMEALGGRRVVRPDVPGSARSPRPAGQPDLAGLASALVDLAGTLGIEAMHLVGHSMGTLVCQHMAALRPALVRSLVLFGPILAPPDAARERLADRAAAARRDGMAAIAEAVSAAGVAGATRSDNPLAVAYIRESHMRQCPEDFAWSCEALARAEAADHRRIACPTLLVTGDEDAIAPPTMAQALAERVAGARTRVLDRCGHWPTIEKPSACREALREALSQAS
ncbi:MAG: alpha/beta hydrolase [Alphaproteobacteria bacterium]